MSRISSSAASEPSSWGAYPDTNSIARVPYFAALLGLNEPDKAREAFRAVGRRCRMAAR